MSNTHVIKIPLLLEEWEKSEIDRRFYAQGTLYNAILLTYLERIDRYRSHPISQLTSSKANNERKNKLKKNIGLSKFDVQKLAGKIARRSKNHLYDGLTVNETASRAHRACQKYLKTGACKPAVKNPYHNHTVIGSGIRQNLRLVMREEGGPKRKSQIKRTLINPDLFETHDDIHNLYLSWTGRLANEKLLMRIDWNSISQVRRQYFIKHLNKLAQTGITKELIRGEWKYYALLVINTPAYRNSDDERDMKEKTGKNIALDTGPYRSHTVDSDNQSSEITPSKEFITKYKTVEEKIKTKQRTIERSRRANPNYQENYNPDGTIKKGVRFDPELRSNNAKKAGQELYELNRKRLAIRDELIRYEVKELVRAYDQVILEKINYSIWQRRYGKSMLIHTPGLFQHLLRIELERHNKELIIMPLRYAFSQSCICGNKVKKKLSNRVHECENNDCLLYSKQYQRDQFSAWLMLQCHKHNLAPADLHSGKLHKLLVSKISNNQRTTIETLLPPTLDQANNTNIKRRLEQDAIIHDKQTLQAATQAQTSVNLS
jgi:hypothetical protein